MAKIYLVEGPVGAGKSTFSAALSQKINAPHLNLDSWMVSLFSPDRPSVGVIEWYVERKARCIEQIWDTALKILNSNCNVILELGMVQRKTRLAMYERIKNAGYKFSVYMLNAPKDERRERVRLRNLQKGSTFSMEVPDEIFEIASDLWEEPDSIEFEEQQMVFVSQATVNKAWHRINR